MNRADLEIARKETSERVVVAPTGELDAGSAESLDDALHEAIGSDVDDVEVELGRLRFIDATGIHVLLGARRAAEGRRKRLRVTHARGQVAQVLTLTGLVRRLI